MVAIFTSQEARAGLILKLLYIPATVCVCVCVCSSVIITCAKFVIPLLCYYSHEHSGSYQQFVGSIGMPPDLHR